MPAAKRLTLTEFRDITVMHRSTAAKTLAKPPRYKLFLLSWLGIYPLVTGMFLLFGPWLTQLPLLLRTLVLTGVLVYAMTYIVMPRLTRIFQRWLQQP